MSPPEPKVLEIGSDDIIPDSSGKETISDIKDVDIVSHLLCEGSIKSEIGLESKHSESVGTRVFVKAENSPFIKAENIPHNEYLIKTEDTGQRVVKVQGKLIFVGFN